MRQQDPELTRLFSLITALEEEYKRAKAETDSCKTQMNSDWNSLHDLQEKYRELKELARNEFQMSKYCWQANDRASAKEHSINGKAMNDQKACLRPYIDSAHERFNSSKTAFENAKARQDNVLNRLKTAQSEKNNRLNVLKAAKAAEDAHWHEKTCKRCGKTIRYRDDWSHEPSYCKECKAKFDEEKKQREKNKREKPCKGCGKTIVYYTDWEHIPNYCKECREKGNTWSSRTAKKLPKKTDTYGILDYTGGIRKQNSKDLSEGKYGTHKWYDPYTGQMGEAGMNYPGKKRDPRYD